MQKTKEEEKEEKAKVAEQRAAELAAGKRVPNASGAGTTHAKVSPSKLLRFICKLRAARCAGTTVLCGHGTIVCAP